MERKKLKAIYNIIRETIVFFSVVCNNVINKSDRTAIYKKQNNYGYFTEK